MVIPAPPPMRLAELRDAVLKALLSGGAPPDARTLNVLLSGVEDREYHPWEWFAHHEPPEPLTREQWWYAVRQDRARTARPTPFTMVDGTRFSFNLPDPLLRLIDDISSQATGQLELPDPVVNPATRDRYLVNSLYEEAITSCQLEGASTTRRGAKRMLREKRRPRDRSEQMILNNCMALERVRELKDQPLTPRMVLDVHAVVTRGTLDDPADVGRIQRPGEERTRIHGDETDDQVLHVPPPAGQLPERMRRLCDFANGVGDFADQYVPPLVRSIIVHFMMGYDHYFVDGNGRTARALFQWSMLHQGFFLAEFLSISHLLCQAPARYARSFLRVEQDEGDLTHFLLAQARVVSRAITDLYAYLARKSSELGRAAALLRRTPLNNRQIAVIESFLRDPSGSVSAVDHQSTHRVSAQTAHNDLRGLEEAGFLARTKRGRRIVWFPAPDMAERVRGAH